MIVFMAISELSPVKAFIPGELSRSPRRITNIPGDWKEKLKAVNPHRNVRIVEREEVVFQGTAAELLAQLEA